MKDNFCYQDWETIVMTKPKNIVTGAQKQKSDDIFYKGNQSLKEEDEINNPEKIHNSLRVSIQQARVSKKMSQKQLAVLMNCQSSVIQQYENGQAIPNNNFICKLEKVLQTKMPRKKKK